MVSPVNGAVPLLPVTLTTAQAVPESPKAGAPQVVSATRPSMDEEVARAIQTTSDGATTQGIGMRVDIRA